jgi:hypothetical protein
MVKILRFEPYYTVEIDGDTGIVKVFSDSSQAKGRELKQAQSPDGYLRIKMGKYYLIHHLVANAFIGERPKGLCVNHKDANKLNNRPDNLEYVTIAENIHHSVKHGMHVCNDPKRSGRYKDGRAVDVKKYKREWYLQNRDRILPKLRLAYAAKKV